jgi:hypothetical protein
VTLQQPTPHPSTYNIYHAHQSTPLTGTYNHPLEPSSRPLTCTSHTSESHKHHSNHSLHLTPLPITLDMSVKPLEVKTSHLRRDSFSSKESPFKKDYSFATSPIAHSLERGAYSGAFKFPPSPPETPIVRHMRSRSIDLGNARPQPASPTTGLTPTTATFMTAGRKMSIDQMSPPNWGSRRNSLDMHYEQFKQRAQMMELNKSGKLQKEVVATSLPTPTMEYPEYSVSSPASTYSPSAPINIPPRRESIRRAPSPTSERMLKGEFSFD